VRTHMRRFSLSTIKRLHLKDTPVEMSVRDLIFLYFAILDVKVKLF